MYAMRLLSAFTVVGLLSFTLLAQSQQASAATGTVDWWSIYAGDDETRNIDAYVEISDVTDGLKFTFYGPTTDESLTRISWESGFDKFLKAPTGEGPFTDDGVSMDESDIGITGKGDMEGDWQGTFFQITKTNGINSGIQTDEMLMITMLFDGAEKISAEALAMLMNMGTEGLRIAGHFQNCTTSGESCSAIANPIPGAVWLFGSALLGLVGIGGYRSRRQRAAS